MYLVGSYSMEGSTRVGISAKLVEVRPEYLILRYEFETNDDRNDHQLLYSCLCGALEMSGWMQNFEDLEKRSNR